MGYLWWERGRTGGQADLPPKPSVTKQPVLLDTFLPSPASVGPSVPGEMPTLQDHWMSQYADAQGQPGMCETPSK